MADDNQGKNIGDSSCLGPNAPYVKLISSDGHVFIVKREHALMSSTIKGMLSGPGIFGENKVNEIKFHNIQSHILQRLCVYFIFKAHYEDNPTQIAEFPIAPEIAVELMMAASFLDC